VSHGVHPRTLSKIAVLCSLFVFCSRDAPVLLWHVFGSLLLSTITPARMRRPIIPAKPHASVSRGCHGDDVIRTATTGVECFPLAVFDNSSRWAAATLHSCNISTTCCLATNASRLRILIFTSAKEGYVFVVVCLFVCLSATLRKNVRTDLHEIFRKCWQWADEQMIKFWWRSGLPSGCTVIVFRFRHYGERRKEVSTDCAARRCSARHAPAGITIATVTSLRHQLRTDVH